MVRAHVVGLNVLLHCRYIRSVLIACLRYLFLENSLIVANLLHYLQINFNPVMVHYLVLVYLQLV